jgi:hypothetical protein
VQADFSVPGTIYEGHVVEITDDIEGDFGIYRLVFLQTATDKISFIAGSVLLDKLKKADPKPGDQLGIRFEGLVKSKKNSGRSYKDWTLAHKPKPSGLFD